jgi:hypothetical protein
MPSQKEWEERGYANQDWDSAAELSQKILGPLCLAGNVEPERGSTEK